MATIAQSTSAPKTAAPPRRKPKKDRAQGNVVVYFAALVLIALMLGPVLYIITGGFRTNAQITSDPAGLPNPWVFSNYLDVLTSGTFWLQVGNSTIAALATTIAVVVLGVMASYVLARYQFRGRGAMYALFAAGLMFPITVAITPLYILVKNLGLVNTLPGIILPQIAFALPTTIIILVPFLQAIPKELEEAALVDGATPFQAFTRILLPLAAPGLAATAIFVILLAWNEFLFSLVLTTDNARTVTPYIGGFITDKAILWGRLYASAAIIMIPVLVFGLAVQKQLAHGLTGGAVKG